MIRVHALRGAISIALLVGCASPGPRPGPPNAAPGLRVLWQERVGDGFPMSIAVDEAGFLYLGAKEGGVYVLDASDGDRVARLRPDAFDGLDAMALARRGDRLYVALGDFFARGGERAGLAIVDVSDPSDPSVVSTWTSEEILGGAAAILVDGDRTYLGAMEEGLFVLDVSDEQSVRLVGSLQPDPDWPREDPGATSRPNARGMALRGDLLYLAYDAGGLRVVDVSDPARPREIGRWINPGPGNKQQAYNEVIVAWPYLYAALDYCGLEILDVRDPTDIRQVGWWNPWGCERPTNLWVNSPGHTNHLAFDARRELVFLSAGDSELQVVDVSNPANPRRAAAYGEPKNGRAAWGMTLDDDRAYLAYIRSIVPFRGTWSGVRALSVR